MSLLEESAEESILVSGFGFLRFALAWATLVCISMRIHQVIKV